MRMRIRNFGLNYAANISSLFRLSRSNRKTDLDVEKCKIQTERKKSSTCQPRSTANIGCLFVCFVEVYAGYEEVEEETDEENGDQQQGQRLHPPAYTPHQATCAQQHYF